MWRSIEREFTACVTVSVIVRVSVENAWFCLEYPAITSKKFNARGPVKCQLPKSKKCSESNVYKQAVASIVGCWLMSTLIYFFSPWKRGKILRSQTKYCSSHLDWYSWESDEMFDNLLESKTARGKSGGLPTDRHFQLANRNHILFLWLSTGDCAYR